MAMKSTGVVRQLDTLGRIVLPIELRRTMDIGVKDMVEIFDPLKDFIRLPRAMRRQMNTDGNSVGLETISVEGPVLKVEVIAIYK